MFAAGLQQKRRKTIDLHINVCCRSATNTQLDKILAADQQQIFLGIVMFVWWTCSTFAENMNIIFENILELTVSWL